MSKNLIKCSKCEEKAIYEETDDPIKITNETGFVPINGGWLCPKCTEDYFHSEGC
jgi:hypothetical protein